MNNVLKEYNEMKEDIKKTKDLIEDYSLLWKTMWSRYCLKCRKNTKSKIQKLRGQKGKNNAFIKICNVW